MKKKDEFNACVKRLHELLDEELDTLKYHVSCLEAFPTGNTNIIPAKVEGKTLMIWGSDCTQHPTWLVKDCEQCAAGEWVEVVAEREQEKQS